MPLVQLELMYKHITSVEQLPVFEPGLPVFCDIETDGLYTNPRIIQMYQPSKYTDVQIIDFDKIPYNTIMELLKPLHTVWYNASYDLGTLNIVTEKVDDMFYAVKIAFPEFQEYALDKTVSNMKLGNYYENIDKKAMQKARFIKGAYLSNAQLVYAATDTIVLNDIYNNDTIQKIINTNLAYKVDIYSLMHTIIWQQNGLDVIEYNRQKYLKDAKARIEQCKIFLPNLNVRSAKQVKEYLGSAASDKATLMRRIINEDDKEAQTILDLRKALNEVSKLESYAFPKVYGKFNPYGTVTGRYNCSGGDLKNGINMQNYPRQFKSIFGTADDDYIMLGADYATLEVRLACMVYGEASMYKALKQGLDLHKYTAHLLTGKPMEDITPDERTNAKPAVFGFTFGLSAANFVDYAFDLFGLKYTLEQSTTFRKGFFDAYPAFAEYHQKAFRAMTKGNYIVYTALGRAIKPRLGTDAINAPVQGSGGECTKMAVHFMVKEDIRSLQTIVNVIHDAIYLKVLKSEQDYWADLLERNMVKAWEEISKSSLFKYHDIPMPVEVGRGQTIKDT